jgi:hypothetical protein
MVMSIQGPTQPGNDFNLYIELLKEELDILWCDEEVHTWDAKVQNYFPMRNRVGVNNYYVQNMNWNSHPHISFALLIRYPHSTKFESETNSF